MDKLKKCPFCGGEAELLELCAGFHVSCNDCDANSSADGWTEDGAVDLWNARTNESPWISVEDELPKDEGFVVTFGFDGPDMCKFRNGKFSSDGFILHVTHWMPLPKPPTEEK